MTEEDVTGRDLLRPGDGARFSNGWNALQLLPDEAVLLLLLPGDDSPDELVTTENLRESIFRGLLLQLERN